MRDAVKRRLLLEEKGFTLTEVLVTMVIMLVVLFALYSLFDMSLRVFSIGNDKVEAVDNARLGLEKMKREIQAAYPYDKTDDSNTPAGAANDYLFWNAGIPGTPAMPSSTSITFGNDLNGNYKIDIPTPPATTPPNEQITYSLNGTTLRRTVGTGTAQPVVEFVQPNSLQFKYFTGTTCNNTVAVGSEINPSSPGSCTQADIAIVRISLTVAVDRGIEDQPVTQTLTTDVALKNRGEQ